MKIHQFESTDAAYNACGTGESIVSGDILVIEPEGVVGIAYVWPFAVTYEAGALHKVLPGPEGDMIRAEFAKSIHMADAIATGLGFEA